MVLFNAMVFWALVAVAILIPGLILLLINTFASFVLKESPGPFTTFGGPTGSLIGLFGCAISAPGMIIRAISGSRAGKRFRAGRPFEKRPGYPFSNPWS
ncbi:MAG: hypothetical protein M1121_06020 [Actinobacteria bacterium]|nr:hypothetical protein [Actinomycetota bacterium]